MKVPAAKIEQFTKNPPANLKGVLLYGPDAGLISERAKSLTAKIIDDPPDPFSIVEFNYKKISDDPAILADELDAMSLTGGRRLIKISDCPSTVSKNILESLIKYKSDTFVIFSAGDLAKTSSIRKFTENEANFAALPCYKDESGNIRSIVAGKLRAEGFNFNNEIVQHLTDSFFGDRMVILNETEKLMIYMGDEKNIAYADVKECIMDSSEAVIDELCAAITARNAYEIDRNLKKSLQEMNPIGIIRIVSSYFIRLQSAKAKLASGMTEQQALSSLRPPVFFKQAPAFKRSLQNWSLPAIQTVLNELLNLEIACKTTSNPAELLCSRVLTILPLAVRK